MKSVTFLLNLIGSFVSFLIVFRILFKFFAANSDISFVSWVYNVSGTLVAPFAGIIPPLVIGRSVVDFTAFIALIVYMVGLRILSELVFKNL